MKILPFALTLLGLAGVVGAKEPAKRTRSSLPGKYPAIIQMTPTEPAAAKASDDTLFHSEMGGREVQFMQNARRAAGDLLALAEVAKARNASEQIKSVGEMLASMQSTERGKLEELAAAKNLPVESSSSGHIKKDLGSLTGAKFEKAWVDRLIQTAGSSVEAYEVGALSGDADLKAFVDKMLPVVRARLQMANRLGGRSVNSTSAPAAGLRTQSETPAPFDPPVPVK